MSSAQTPPVNQAAGSPAGASNSSTSGTSTTTPPSSQATGSTASRLVISGQPQPPIHLSTLPAVPPATSNATHAAPATPLPPTIQQNTVTSGTSQSTAVPTSTSNHPPPQTTLPNGPQSQAPQGTFIRRFWRFYTKSKPKEWTTFWLTPHGLLGFLLSDLGLIGGITAIKIVSHSKRGLADVSDSTNTVLNYPVGQSLWWTFFPVLIFQIFGLYFAAIIDSRGERQPFVALRRPGGADTKTSILLDYRSKVAAVRPLAAFRNRHWMLGVSFLAALLISLFLSSLASHLLIANIVPMVDTTLTHLSSTFQPYDFGYDSDLTPVLDVVSSTLVYGGLFPAWTTSNMSFQSFDRPPMSLKPSILAAYLADTTAYSARLQCRSLAKAEYVFTQTDDGTGWDFGAQDHGCDFSPTLIIATAGFQNYVQTFSNVSCSLDAGLSRLFVLAAHTPDPDTIKPSEVTVLSCRTAYFKHSGTLNVTYTLDGSSAVINSFQEHEHGLQPLDNPMPVYYQNFERQLHQPSILDDTATTSATNFGRLILAHARKQAPRSSFNPRAMLNATSVLFTAAHAVMVSSFLWQAGGGATAESTVQGSLSIPTMRLVVVDSIANVLLSTLAVLAVLTVWIAVDLVNNETSLFEEPTGLLGSAILLHESSVNALAADLRSDPEAAQDGKALAHARRPRRLWGRNLPWGTYRDDVRKKKWSVEKWNMPSETKIVEV
ncbi:hypothetical protein A1O7_02829 [Cladophialophora yegresii CBS 114405]|uniref:Uncharacterized protein n=1 Tax=Cladophialophora yegresii CBS 114405 TaxID=1182544 RepID=W9WVV0_9EURO|nr:uncharacterized protein A1O7_02829 [Cladophialophora yegresii CBS 114405]EXJ62394.1 hypothetical protein A1O7_02829 [Cladophialophora yegresii CBS 114405]